MYRVLKTPDILLQKSLPKVFSNKLLENTLPHHTEIFCPVICIAQEQQGCHGEEENEAGEEDSSQLALNS